MHASHARLTILAALVTASLLAIAFLNSYENWGDDWAQYMLQAQAIVGHQVRACVEQNRLMMQLSALRSGPVAYPWGLPVLLAIEASLFSFQLWVFKIGNVLILLALVVAVYRLARQSLTEAEAVAAALMFAFNPVLLHYCNHVVSELPFTFVSVCALIAMEGGDRRRQSILRRLSIGALVFLAFTIRLSGLLLLVAATFKDFISHRRSPRDRAAALLQMYAPFVLLFTVWSLVLPSGGEGYTEILSSLSVHKTVATAGAYSILVFDFFTGGVLSRVVALVLGPLVVIGAVKSWRRTAHLTMYGLLTIALYAVWPASPGFRFMIPVTPCAVILLVAGLDVLTQAGWTKRFLWLPAIARAGQFGLPAAFLLASLTLVLTGRVPRELTHPYDASSSEMFAWVQRNTPRDAIISFFKPRAMHLLTDRLSLSGRPEDVPKTSYFVYTKDVGAWNDGQPPLREFQQRAELTQAFENRNFIVFRVSRRQPNGLNSSAPTVQPR
jgi:hypothetical protein